LEVFSFGVFVIGSITKTKREKVSDGQCMKMRGCVKKSDRRWYKGKC